MCPRSSVDVYTMNKSDHCPRIDSLAFSTWEYITPPISLGRGASGQERFQLCHVYAENRVFQKKDKLENFFQY